MGLLRENAAIPPEPQFEPVIRQHMADALEVLLRNRVQIEEHQWFAPDFRYTMGACAYVEDYVLRHFLGATAGETSEHEAQFTYKIWGVQDYLRGVLYQMAEQWSEFSGSHPYPVGLSNIEAVELYSQQIVSEHCMDEDDPAILAEWLYEMVSTDTHKSMYGRNVYGLARWRLIDHWFLHLTTSLNSD